MQDDFQELAEKIKAADALVIGAYTPYGQIDAFTKALLERFWSFRHRNNLLRGKRCATVLTGLDPRVMEAVNTALATEIRDYERMELVGQLSIQGNLPCLTCGEGDTCEMSGVQLLLGPDAITTEIEYARVEDQESVWTEATRLGALIGEHFQAR
jgi:multimeric flavodoxin WrbA